MESRSKLIFTITALASLAITLTVEQEVAAPSSTTIVIINKSTNPSDHGVFQSPSVAVHET